jgi:twitching motility protein PilU
MVLRYIRTGIPTSGGVGSARCLEPVGHAQARDHSHGRRDRVGQVDDARGHDRSSQSQAPGHIITIEDPIEFVHPHQQCIISQRELGLDTKIIGVR